MEEKIKQYGPTIIMSIFFYMMISTPHSRPLGDILLESMGLKAWTNGSSGLHLTVIYILALMMMVSLLTKKYVSVNRKLKTKRIILVFIISVTAIYFGHSAYVQNIMANNEGLYSVALSPSDHYYQYSIIDGEVEKFYVDFELTNYSPETKSFIITGINEQVIDFEIYNKSAGQPEFSIGGNTTIQYILTLDDFVVDIKDENEIIHFQSEGFINALTLLDSNGNSVKTVSLSDIGVKN